MKLTTALLGAGLLLAAGCGSDDGTPAAEAGDETSEVPNSGGVDEVVEETTEEEVVEETTEEEEPGIATEAPEGKTSDAQGDARAGTEEVLVEGLGVDILLTYLESLDSGELCFIIDVNGDGEQVAKEAGNYLIIVEVVHAESEGGGWGARVQYRFGELEPGSVQVGVHGPGRPKLEGATVTAAWDDSDTVRTCVDGGETTLGVETFAISTNAFGTTDGDVFDQAEGVAAP